MEKIRLDKKARETRGTQRKNEGRKTQRIQEKKETNTG
jgi:hypothetical protein